uniref:Uncharacterized protein n=1 Tax=Lepeophtheirus salmonis TaxID=72036 RepID=A0A0K2TYV2_LEPSM
MYGSYSRVDVASLTLLIVFPSTYLCDSAHASMVKIKIKSQNRLIDFESAALFQKWTRTLRHSSRQNKCKSIINLNASTVAFRNMFFIAKEL